MLQLEKPFGSRQALVQFGQGVAEMVGSIGGTVFARNRGGAYARNRVTPLDPQTTLQIAVRSTLNSLMQRYASLTTVQKDAWKVYAENVTVINRLGASITLTGNNWYIGMNQLRKQNGLARVDDPPVPFTVGETDPSSVATILSVGPSLSLTFDTLLSWPGTDDAFMAVYTSRPVNVDVNFYKGPFQLAGTLLGNTAIPLASPQLVTPTLPIAVGQKMFVRTVIGEADGRYGPANILSDIAS